MHRYDATKELKTKAFKTKEENIKQTIGIQVTFISEIKLQKHFLLAKYDHFSEGNASLLNEFHSYCFKKFVVILTDFSILNGAVFRNFSYSFCLRLENFPMPFVIHGLALLLDLILNLVFGKQSS